MSASRASNADHCFLLHPSYCLLACSHLFSFNKPSAAIHGCTDATKAIAGAPNMVREALYETTCCNFFWQTFAAVQKVGFPACHLHSSILDCKLRLATVVQPQMCTHRSTSQNLKTGCVEAETPNVCLLK